MMQIVRASQMISPGSNFVLSGLPQQDKSKIYSISGRVGSALRRWSPTAAFPNLLSVRIDTSYLILSNSASSFVPYEIIINPHGLPAQDDYVAELYHFFTYRRLENFSLNSLASEVRAKIYAIYTDGRLASSQFQIWRPSAFINSFSALVNGRTYLFVSKPADFSPYNIGIPSPLEGAPEFLDDAIIPDAGLLPREFIGV
jgi:hypothetical protein